MPQRVRCLGWDCKNIANTFEVGRRYILGTGSGKCHSSNWTNSYLLFFENDINWCSLILRGSSLILPKILKSFLCVQLRIEHPKHKQHPVVDGTGDRSKVRCCKEQCCIGTWNVRSMNQGKLEVVKQETERENIDILVIRELRWTGMGEFNSDDHYIYYCGQESLRRDSSS